MIELRSLYRASQTAAALLAGLAGPAGAVTDSAFTYTTFKPGYLSVDPMDMAPSDNTHAFGNGAAALTGSPGSCFNTGLNLPQEAWLFSLQIYYTSGAPSDVVYSIYRNILATGSFNEIVTNQILDDTNTRKGITVNFTNNQQRQIRNDLYSYGLSICLGAGDSFQGAKILYHYNSAGD